MRRPARGLLRGALGSRSRRPLPEGRARRRSTGGGNLARPPSDRWAGGFRGAECQRIRGARGSGERCRPLCGGRDEVALPLLISSFTYRGSPGPRWGATGHVPLAASGADSLVREQVSLAEAPRKSRRLAPGGRRSAPGSATVPHTRAVPALRPRAPSNGPRARRPCRSRGVPGRARAPRAGALGCRLHFPRCPRHRARVGPDHGGLPTHVRRLGRRVVTAVPTTSGSAASLPGVGTAPSPAGQARPCAGVFQPGRGAPVVRGIAAALSWASWARWADAVTAPCAKSFRS